MAEVAEQGGAGTGLGIGVALDDPRYDFVLRLVSEGALSVEDAKDVLHWTNPTDDLKDIAGLVTGEKGVATRVIASALSGTEWEMSHTEIESRGRGWDTYIESIGEGVVKPAISIWEGYLRWPDRAAWGLAKSGVDAVWGEEGYYGEAAEAERGDRTRVQSRTREEINRLLDQGYISKNEAKELRNLTGDYGAENYNKLYDRLSGIYQGMDNVDREEALAHNSVLQGLSRRGGDRNAPEGIEPSDATAAVDS